MSNAHHITADVRFASTEEVHRIEKQLAHLLHIGESILSAISDFAAKQQAFNDRQGAAVDALVVAQAGLTGDVANLNAQILALQNSPGQVTPEDQALLDKLQASGEAVTAKTEAVATALTALDAMTPPVVPPVTP